MGLGRVPKAEGFEVFGLELPLRQKGSRFSVQAPINAEGFEVFGLEHPLKQKGSRFCAWDAYLRQKGSGLGAPINAEGFEVFGLEHPIRQKGSGFGLGSCT